MEQADSTNQTPDEVTPTQEEIQAPKQEAGQSFISYVSELEKLENITEAQLIEKIIEGVLDEDLKQRLMGKSNLRLSKVIKMGLEAEEYDVVSRGSIGVGGLKRKMKRRMMCCACCTSNRKKDYEIDV
jgi:hypothetical protein